MDCCLKNAGQNTHPADVSQTWRQVADQLDSSYKANGYGGLLYSLVMANRPRRAVEIGTLHSYSALHIGAALREIGRGHLDCYDLWETYPFRHSRMVDVQETIDKAGLHDWIKLHHCDAMHVAGQIESPSLDFVHVDISNDGDTYLWAANVFRRFLSDPSSLLVLEGGTADRDKVHWMTAGFHRPIRDVLPSLSNEWNIIVLQGYPGMTIMGRR